MGLAVPSGIPCGTRLHVPVACAFTLFYQRTYGGTAMTAIVIERKFVIGIRKEHWHHKVVHILVLEHCLFQLFLEYVVNRT